jgi:hypothetical protein
MFLTPPGVVGLLTVTIENGGRSDDLPAITTVDPEVPESPA